jgi:hypothetical protein
MTAASGRSAIRSNPSPDIILRYVRPFSSLFAFLGHFRLLVWASLELITPAFCTALQAGLATAPQEDHTTPPGGECAGLERALIYFSKCLAS